MKENSQYINNMENWLLNSGIRIKEGTYCGGFFGWKNLENNKNSNRYQFIYNEIIGYSLSCFSYLYAETKRKEYLLSMEQSIKYIKRNILSNCLMNTGIRTDSEFSQKGKIENQIYSFDNGMILAGLINYYKLTCDSEVYNMAVKLGNSMIEHFFRNNQISTALLDLDLKTMTYGLDKWSTQIGPYHAKLGIGFIDLYQATKNQTYLNICDNLCEFASDMQNEDGSFANNIEGSDTIIYLHPHLYACEGLTYVSSLRNNKEILEKGLRGIKWAVSTLTSSGGIPRNTLEKTDQADCTSQLLRLILLYRKELEEYFNLSSNHVDHVIRILYERIIRFYLDSENAIRYDDNSNFACTWCTMFSLQALILLEKTTTQSPNSSLINFFI